MVHICLHVSFLFLNQCLHRHARELISTLKMSYGNVYFYPHWFVVLRWYECVCVCVWGWNGLEVCAALAYQHISLFHTKPVPQAHTHMLPQTIWGQRTNGAKSGYCLSMCHTSTAAKTWVACSNSPGRCVNTRYVINNSAYFCASVILFLLDVSINNHAYLCLSVVLFLLDVSINNSAYLMSVSFCFYGISG